MELNQQKQKVLTRILSSEKANIIELLRNKSFLMFLMIFGPLFQILKNESNILHGKKITEEQFLQKGFISLNIYLFVLGQREKAKFMDFLEIRS